MTEVALGLLAMARGEIAESRGRFGRAAAIADASRTCSRGRWRGTIPACTSCEATSRAVHASTRHPFARSRLHYEEGAQYAFEG